jgi:hypothetical protein
MMVFAEPVAVELAVTVSLGAVLGLVSGLLSMPEQADRRNRRQACCRRGSVAAFEAALYQERPTNGHRS